MTGAALRLATAQDGPALARIYAPAVTEGVISFELVPPDGDEMGRRVAAVTERLPWLVYEAEGRVLGYAYASAHRDRAAYDWSVDVSAYVDRAAHRRGLGRRLYTALFGVLVRQGFVNAYAGITLPNAASEGLHAAMGFEPVGIYRSVGYKNGAWHDVVWLHRPLRPREAEPAAPRPLRELAPDAVAQAMRVPGG